MDLETFTERALQLRTLIEQAREAEAKAFGEVKGLQGDMIQSITQEDESRLALLENRYSEVESHWRNCSLYTAELRAEMQDLIKERNGELPPGSFNGAHGATTKVTLSSTRGLALAPSRAKAARITPSDISPKRQQLVVAAFPDVDPRYTQNTKLPIGDAQIRLEFDGLCNAGDSDEVALEPVVDYFRSLDTIGAPVDQVKWICESLCKLRPALRRQLDKSGHPKDGATITVNYDQFAFLVLRWAQH